MSHQDETEVPRETVDQTREQEPPGVLDEPGRNRRTDPLRTSRTSSAWVAAVGFGVVLVLLVVFIVQNTEKVQISFLGWNGHTSLAVALLVAAAGGILVTATAGTLRILQLRRRVRRERRRSDHNGGPRRPTNHEG